MRREESGDEMKRYKIGQFAKEMGVTQDLIKHYEKYGIVVPEKDKDSNYRYYSIRQGERLIESKLYRNLGFSIRESADLILNQDLADIRAGLAQKRTQLEEESARLERYAQHIGELERACAAFDGPDGTWRIGELPGFYFLKQTENQGFSQGEDVQNRVNQWLEHIPITFQALRVPGQALQSEAPFHYQWGVGLAAEQAQTLALSVDPPIVALPPAKYLTCSVRLDGAAPVGRQVCASLLKVMNRFDVRYGEDILGQCILKSHEKGHRWAYYLFHIPILET